MVRQEGQGRVALVSHAAGFSVHHQHTGGTHIYVELGLRGEKTDKALKTSDTLGQGRNRPSSRPRKKEERYMRRTERRGVLP